MSSGWRQPFKKRKKFDRNPFGNVAAFGRSIETSVVHHFWDFSSFDSSDISKYVRIDFWKVFNVNVDQNFYRAAASCQRTCLRSSTLRLQRLKWPSWSFSSIPMASAKEAMDTSSSSDNLAVLLAEFEERDEVARQKIKLREVNRSLHSDCH